MLFDMAQRIPRSIHGVNRVIFAFGPRLNQSRYLPLDAPNGAELDSQLGYGITETRLQTKTIEQLQAADAIVSEVLFEDDLFYKLSQVPVVLFVSFSSTP